MHILVVDDDQMNRDYISTSLTALGHCTDEAPSAERGLQLVQEHQYDVVLVDYRMPGHDGLWFMEQARLPRKTVALLITGFLDRQVVNAMFRVGIRGYVAKPFTPDDLTRHIDFYTQ